MTKQLTQADAEVIARKYLDRDGNPYQMAIVSEKTQSYDFGYVIFYAPKKFLETKNPADLVPGIGPLVVDFRDNQAHPLPSAVNPEVAIKTYKELRNKKSPK